jgi:hypothetical protein
VPYFEEVTCGCFYWAWGLYCDFQLYLFVPLYIILYRKSRKAAIALFLFLIFGNIAALMVIAQVLNLKAGPISVEGYFLFANTNKFYCYFGP